MKKIYLILICVASLFSASYAFNEANIQKAYGTYLTKLRTCSPYTYNVDGDLYIMKILGRYNRRCVLRIYSYSSMTECNFKNEDLRAHYKAMPSPKIYTENIYKTKEQFDKSATVVANKIKEIHDEFKRNGTCTVYGEQKTEKE